MIGSLIVAECIFQQSSWIHFFFLLCFVQLSFATYVVFESHAHERRGKWFRDSPLLPRIEPSLVPVEDWISVFEPNKTKVASQSDCLRLDGRTEHF